MLEVSTVFKKGALIITLGGDLVKNTVSDLNNIVDLFKNDGFSCVIIKSSVRCDCIGYKKLKKLKRMNNVIFI